MRVKIRGISNLYVLLIYAPGSGTTLVRRRVSRREFPEIHPGDVVRAARRRLRVTSVSRRVEMLDEFESVQFRHDEIRNHQVVPPRLEELERLGAVGRLGDLVLLSP